MRVIAVDDDALSLDFMQFQLQQVPVFTEIVPFRTPEAALMYLKNNDAKVAFCDIMMDGMDGIELARRIKELRPQCRIIFASSSPDYALQAFRVHADGYITKPVTHEAVMEELAHLSLVSPKEEDKDVLLRVKCFGNFEAFDMNNVPLKFARKKTKELLAYLVHHCGATCSLAELAGILYEDRDDSPSLQSLIRNLVADLKKTLQAAGAESVLFHENGMLAVFPAKLSCDYYDYNKGISEAVNSYNGEYMTQYSWSDVTTAHLDARART